MVTDSITNASIPMASSNAKDLAKKKRANRSAKLKQVKLDARREQWLSQVKKKDVKEESNGRGGYSAQSVHARNERHQVMKNLEINPRSEENDESIHHFSDPESPSNSILGGTESGTNFSSSSSSSSSCSSGGSCSGSISEEDGEGDDDCLDDWEAVADALAATDDKQEQHSPSSDSPELPAHISQLDSNLEPKSESVIAAQQKAPPTRAWRADDASRPQSLPNLSKQRSFPVNSGRRSGCGGVAWGCKNVIPAPSSCPICCEDLDLTDSSFLPCLCGFRLCLFCHKRILEEDARCPGCRKQYDNEPNKEQALLDGGNTTLQLARSFSMITRS